MAKITNNTLSAESITQGLATSFVGQNTLYYPTLASTMDVAREQAVAEATEGTVVVAGEQTTGRGRIERAWVSPPGNIAFSVILYPPPEYLPYLIMVASLAVAHCIQTVTGLHAQIKWPNDVLINGKKVCGILIENKIIGNHVAYVIIGIGLNVNLRVVDYPEIASIATSLSDETGKALPLVEVTRQLLRDIEALYLKLPDGEAIFREWRDNLVTIGKPVRATWGDTVCEGVAESVAADGSLLLREANGNLTRIVAGDVTLRQ